MISGSDQHLDRRIKELVRNAVSDAPQPRDEPLATSGGNFVRTAPQAARRRWMPAIIAAAVAIAAASLVVVVLQRSPERVVQSTPLHTETDQTEVSATDQLVVPPTTAEPTTADPTTAAPTPPESTSVEPTPTEPTDAATTTLAPATNVPSEDGALTVPFTGGDPVDPEVLTTIPFGGGPGQLAGASDQGWRRIAVTNDNLIVVEIDAAGTATGKALLLDRNGAWLRDVAVPELEGRLVRWAAGSPNGTVFLITDSQDYSSGKLDAFRLIADRAELVQSQPVPSRDYWNPPITGTGVGAADDVLMTIDTGAVEGESASADYVQVDAETPSGNGLDPSSSGRVKIRREDGTSWTIDFGYSAEAPPLDVTGTSGAFGGGAWHQERTSEDPAAKSSFLAILRKGAPSSWSRLGDWLVVASTNDTLILESLTPEGVQLAEIKADN